MWFSIFDSVSFWFKFSFLFNRKLGLFDFENVTIPYKIWGPLLGLIQFLATESPLKMIKNVFYFTSKTLFVPKIFKILSWLFGHVAKQHDEKGKVIFKFYDVTAWLTSNRLRILPNISRSIGNQTMEFGQLIECNMRNIFLEKSYTKCGGETSPRPFSEKLKLSISLDQ